MLGTLCLVYCVQVRVGCGDGSAIWTGMRLGGLRCGQGGGDDIVRLKSMYADDKKAGGDET